MTIEVCANDEWMGQLLGCETAEVGSGYAAEAIKLLEAAGFEAVLAKGRRSLYHGWNGAHFALKTGGLGTFNALTAEEFATISAIDDAARSIYV